MDKEVFLFCAIAFAVAVLCTCGIACYAKRIRSPRGIVGMFALCFLLFGYAANELRMYQWPNESTVGFIGGLAAITHACSFVTFCMFLIPLLPLDGSLYGLVANLIGYFAIYAIIIVTQKFVGYACYGKNFFPHYALY